MLLVCSDHKGMSKKTSEVNSLLCCAMLYYVTHASKKAAFKIILETSFAMKATLRNNINPSNMKYSVKSWKRLLVAKYWIFKKSLKLEILSHWLTDWLHSLTHLLPDHSRKPRTQTKQQMATILHDSNKFMCLLGFQRVRGLCTSLFLLSSIRLFFFFMLWNHINVLIFPIHTFLEQCI